MDYDEDPRIDQRASAARDNLNDLEPVAWMEATLLELRRSDRLAVMFHDDASRKKLLPDQEIFDGAGQGGFDRFSVGYQAALHQADRLAGLRMTAAGSRDFTASGRAPLGRMELSQSFHTGS